MSTDIPGSREASTPDLMTAPTSSTTETMDFFSFPPELRGMIYYYLFKDVYIQMRVNARLRNLRLDQPDGGQASPAPQLEALQASRRLWEEGSIVLYGENSFHFHIGSEDFNTTLLTRKITDLMKDIEIKLHSSKVARDPEVVRVLQLFGTPHILRRSCLIKLQFCDVILMSHDMIEAIKQMTCFKVLRVEVAVPDVVQRQDRVYGGYIPGLSPLLAFIQRKLTPALGPGTFANDPCLRRLIFKPQDQKEKQIPRADAAE